MSNNVSFVSNNSLSRFKCISFCSSFSGSFRFNNAPFKFNSGLFKSSCISFVAHLDLIMHRLSPIVPYLSPFVSRFVGHSIVH